MINFWNALGGFLKFNFCDTFLLRLTGMVINLTDLKRILQDEVLQLLDHRNIDK